MKRKLLKPLYECRCNGRLQTKRFTRLTHTGSVVELEHLKIKTRLTNEKFASSEPEGLTSQHIRVHLEHIRVQEVGHHIVLRRCRTIQGHCRRRKHCRHTSCSSCDTSWSEETGACQYCTLTCRDVNVSRCSRMDWGRKPSCQWSWKILSPSSLGAEADSIVVSVLFEYRYSGECEG
jgi:hypothetical protein